MDPEVRERINWLNAQTWEFRRDWIAALQSENGGFTKESLESIGIEWPPPRGWRSAFVHNRPMPGQISKRKARKEAKRKRKEERKKAGRTKSIIRDEFLRSYEWRRLRYAVLKKYAGKCMCCGRGAKEGVILHVDHIKCRKRYPELALVFDNLQILCAACNHGKGNWDDTDWRPDMPHPDGIELAKLMGEMA